MVILFSQEKRGAVAQSAEHGTRNHNVVGSNPDLYLCRYWTGLNDEYCVQGVCAQGRIIETN